jgi:hypothetical protein
MLDDLHRRVANLVSRQKLMKLGKVTVCLKNVQQVQSQIDTFFIIVSQSARYCAK